MKYTNIPKTSTAMLAILCFMMLMNNQQLLAQCSLSCNSNINVSLSANCEANITPEVMIKNLNSNGCSGSFVIEVYDAQGNVILNNPVVTAPYVGQSLEVRAIDSNSGLFCWGNIHIEDKQYPVFECVDDTIACNEAVPSITVLDNCDASPSLTFTETITNLNCSDPEFNFLITRIYIATDSSGNANTCEQVIRVAKPDLADVDFPPNYDGVAAPMLDCDNPDTSPENTGYPSLNGSPLGEYCKINVNYTDQIIDICDGSYKILRKWLVLDCCTSEIITHFQVIKVVDTTAPMITCPDDFTSSTDFDACTATILLPNAMATDDCSADANITISIDWAFGQGQGPFLNIPIGTHVVTYTATDDCDNSSTCTMEVTVEDQIIPVAVCNPITVSLVTDTVKAFAFSFDSGSSDNCAIDSFFVRRMEDTLFTNCVFFDCDDVDTTVMVVFRVCDTVGLCNECMVEVTVQDKTPPAIICPADVVLDCDEYPPSLAQTGQATATDNCVVDSLYFVDEDNLNICNIGTITRTWYARDKEGLVDSCTQLIVIGDPDPATYSFPPDINVQCLDDIDPSNTGIPMVNDNCPNLPAIGRQDTLLTIIPNCLYFLRRGWIIVDDCNDTIVRHTQVINIEDTQAPIFTQTPGSLDSTFACLGDVVFPAAPTASDNCNDVVTVTLLEADTLPGNCPDNYIIDLTYIASDSCGNLSASFVTTLMVVDTIAPTANPLPDLGPFACVNLVDPANINMVTGETDNCGSPVIVSHLGDATPPNCANSFIRTYQLSDQCGNTRNLTQVILLNDTIAPTADPLPNLGPFDCVADVDLVNTDDVTGEMDNCGGIVSVSHQGDTDITGCSGTIIRTYRLDDGCGNTTDITQTIIIDDQTPPVWDQQEKALDLELACGSAIVVIPVPTATDQCNDATITQVSDDTLSIGCTNQYIRDITYEATDSCGNVAAPFVVRIVVNDSIQPEWTTPMGSLNSNFDCSDDVVVPSPPTASDNCVNVMVMLVSDDTTNLSCGDQYVRTLSYRAVDDCGREVAIPFNVTLTVNDDITPTWNEAQGSLDTAFICATDIVLPVPTASDNCSGVIVQPVLDDTLSMNCANQYVRRVIYQARDSCGNILSLVFPVTITVNDTIPPMITSCPRDTSDFDFPILCSEPYTFIVEGMDNCGTVNFTYTRSDSVGLVFDGGDASGNYPTGTTVITYIADDGCGNTDTCSNTVFIDDLTLPTIALCQGTTFHSPSPSNPVELLPLFFVSGKDDCSPTDVFFNGNDPNPMIFTCADLNGLPFVQIPISVSVVDTFGNSTVCNTNIILQNDSCMTIPLASVTGQLLTDNAQGMAQAMVQINGEEIDTSFSTLANGYYILPELEMHHDYIVTPQSDIDPMNGINTLDLIHIAEHILAIDTFDSPYKIIAADVNRSGNISIGDMVELSRLILNIDPTFQNNTSWRFVDAHHEFDNPINPFAAPFPESRVIQDIDHSMSNMNFVAIKVGDVNNSAILNGFTNSGDTREEEILTIQANDQLMKAGENYTIEFKAKDFQNIKGYQFTLDFDPRYVEFIGLEESSLSESLALTPSNFGWSEIKEGKIRSNWFHHQIVNLPDEEILFALSFKARTEIPVSRVMEINSSELKAEAYNREEQPLKVVLEFATSSIVHEGFKLYQNRPNPFQEETIIPFLLPEAGKASLSIMDVTGRVVKIHEQHFEAGYHEIRIEKNDLPEGGIFFYQLKVGDQEATKKMLLSNF